jgi:hypothetical protein
MCLLKRKLHSFEAPDSRASTVTAVHNSRRCIAHVAHLQLHGDYCLCSTTGVHRGAVLTLRLKVM